jgi:hypothetical protein
MDKGSKHLDFLFVVGDQPAKAADPPNRSFNSISPLVLA